MTTITLEAPRDLCISGIYEIECYKSVFCNAINSSWLLARKLNAGRLLSCFLNHYGSSWSLEVMEFETSETSFPLGN